MYVFRYVYTCEYGYGLVHEFAYDPVGVAQTLRYTCFQSLVSHAVHVRGLLAEFAPNYLRTLRPQQQLEEGEDGQDASCANRAQNRAAGRAEGTGTAGVTGCAGDPDAGSSTQW